MNRWCKSIGWQLIWNVNADYPIVTSWNITGSFENELAFEEILAYGQAIRQSDQSLLELEDAQ